MQPGILMYAFPYKRISVSRLWSIALVYVAIGAFAAAQTISDAAQRPGGPSAGLESEAIREETFQIVWKTVRDKHFDPTFGGVDWEKVREKYAPLATAAKSNQELHILLQKMLGELKQSHFNIIPPEAVVEDQSAEAVTGGVGIDIRMIDGRAIVSRVERGSPSDTAGLRQGFVVERIGGVPVKQIAERLSTGSISPSISLLRITRAILARMSGKPGTRVDVAFKDGNDQSREATLVCEPLKGEMSPPLGNFPSQYTEFEARRLPGDIGYIRFNIFTMPIMAKIREAIRTMSNASGLIFDLRGNPGGFGGMSSGIAGLLENEQTSLGTMRMRTAKQNFAVYPQENPYLGPVVIVIDGLSASTSEVFAAGLQDIGRAVVVGETSLGAALPSVFLKLPTGARFQYAIADFQSPKGVRVEGRGVTPDIEVRLTRKALLQGRDPQIEAAIDEVKKKAASYTRRAAGF